MVAERTLATSEAQQLVGVGLTSAGVGPLLLLGEQLWSLHPESVHFPCSALLPLPGHPHGPHALRRVLLESPPRAKLCNGAGDRTARGKINFKSITELTKSREEK